MKQPSRSFADFIHNRNEPNPNGLKKTLKDGPSVTPSITQHCRWLRRIDLSHCPLVTDFGLKFIGERCPALDTLRLECCDQISDQGITEVAKGCRDLVELNVSCCWRIMDPSVVALAANCHHLEVLDLTSTRVKNAVIQLFACRKLRDLRLRCLDIDDDALMTFHGLGKNNTLFKAGGTLDLTECPNISALAKHSLEQNSQVRLVRRAHVPLKDGRAKQHNRGIGSPLGTRSTKKAFRHHLSSPFDSDSSTDEDS